MMTCEVACGIVNYFGDLSASAQRDEGESCMQDVRWRLDCRRGPRRPGAVLNAAYPQVPPGRHSRCCGSARPHSILAPCSTRSMRITSASRITPTSGGSWPRHGARLDFTLAFHHEPPDEL